MIVTFKPSKSGVMRWYHSAELTCESAGEYEVSDALGKQLCADFPENFKAKGGSKAAGPPEKNRAAAPPDKNK